jgi:hypothetical protein
MGKGQGGIFSGPNALGTLGLGDALSDMIASCTANMIGSQDYEGNTLDAAGAAAFCATQAANYQKCGGRCNSIPEDTPEWANCVQKCHGVPPVDYSAEKKVCTDKGLTFSWINGGCVDPAKYAGCPKGYTYFKYKDGTERCTAQTDWTDPGLLQGKCPAGSEVKPVPGGSTCVSIKQPAPVTTKCQTGYVLSGGKCVKKTSTPVQPVTPYVPPSTLVQPATQSSFLSNPLALLAIGAVVVGGIVVIAAKRKKGKGKGGKKVQANKSRRR